MIFKLITASETITKEISDFELQINMPDDKVKIDTASEHTCFADTIAILNSKELNITNFLTISPIIIFDKKTLTIISSYYSEIFTHDKLDAKDVLFQKKLYFEDKLSEYNIPSKSPESLWYKQELYITNRNVSFLNYYFDELKAQYDKQQRILAKLKRKEDKLKKLK